MLGSFKWAYKSSLGCQTRMPKSVDEALSCTLEVESYMLTVSNRKFHHVNIMDQDSTPIETIVSAMLANQDKVMDMLHSLTIHLPELSHDDDTTEDSSQSVPYTSLPYKLVVPKTRKESTQEISSAIFTKHDRDKPVK